jgi:hypothetical protein
LDNARGLTHALENAFERFKRIAERSFAGRKSCADAVNDFALPNVFKEGMAHGVFTDVAPLYTESGSVSGAVGTSTDITDR